MTLADISEGPFLWRPASLQVAGQQLAGVIKHSRLRDSIMDIRTSYGNMRMRCMLITKLRLPVIKI